MTTLVSQANAVIPVGTYNFGPFPLTAGQPVTAHVVPSTWPASGDVFSFTVTYGDGQGGGGLFQGSASAPTLKGGATGIDIRVSSPTATTCSVRVVVSQTFTASISVTSP